MKGRGLRALGFLLIASLIATGFAAAKVQSGGGRASRTLGASGCQLNSVGGKIKHVVYLQFDNTHYSRDNPTVASDLEQMPHLLNFLKSSGTLFTNDHTVLISHTAGGILSTQTGLYPDRHGITVSNSYFYFPPSKIPAFSTAFKYWTDLVDDSTGTNDPLPNMVTDQKVTPGRGLRSHGLVATSVRSRSQTSSSRTPAPARSATCRRRSAPAHPNGTTR